MRSNVAISKKKEPPPTRDVNRAGHAEVKRRRNSGTDRAIRLRQGYGGQDGVWLRRLGHLFVFAVEVTRPDDTLISLVPQ